MTLIELLISMVIFSVVVSASASVLIALTRDVIMVRRLTQAQVELRAMTNTMSRSIVQASEVTAPGRSGDRSYVEFRLDLVPGEPPVCVQWRHDPTLGQIQERRWSSDDAPTDSWRPIAKNVANDPDAQPPFVLAAGDALRPTPRLTLDLSVQEVGGPATAASTAVQIRNNAPERPTPSCAGPRP